LENASNTVLSICLNHEAADVQRMLLEEHGYHVLIAGDLREVDRISKNFFLDCAVLGSDLGNGMKHAIAALLCDNRPAIAILEEYSDSPVLPDADHVPAGHPADLLAALDDLLAPYGHRHTAHLQRKANALVKTARQVSETARYIVRESRRLYTDSRRRRNKRKKEERVA